jgi:hypothetical protein
MHHICILREHQEYGLFFFVAESCLMDIIEVNLCRPLKLDYLVFETIDVMPAFGIVSLTGEVAD